VNVDIKIRGNEIIIDTDYCWVTGEKFTKNHPTLHKTIHHTLPKHLKPKYNVLVPVSIGAHREINKEDKRGMINFLYKIKQTSWELKTMVDSLLKIFKKKDDKKPNSTEGRTPTNERS